MQKDTVDTCRVCGRSWSANHGPGGTCYSPYSLETRIVLAIQLEHRAELDAKRRAA